jgi:uncharacterized DUF497 family protein
LRRPTRERPSRPAASAGASGGVRRLQQLDRPSLVAVGDFDGDLHTLVVRPLGTEAISLISFRPASNKERRA